MTVEQLFILLLFLEYFVLEGLALDPCPLWPKIAGLIWAQPSSMLEPQKTVYVDSI